MVVFPKTFLLEKLKLAKYRIYFKWPG